MSGAGPHPSPDATPGTGATLFPGRRATFFFSAAIAAIAVALRCWRIGWGLGEGTRYLGFPDEIISWLAYVRDFLPLACSSFDQKVLNYPTLYGYAVGLSTWLFHALGLVEVADAAHPLLHPAPDALLVARSVSAAAGLATVAVTGILAGSAYSRRAGLFAAALMAVVPFEVLYSHIASPDTLLTTCMAAALLFSFFTASCGDSRSAAAAGFAAGAAAATKYTGLAVAVAVAWAIAEYAWRRRSARTGFALAASALAGFAAAALLGCPPCVLHPDRMLDAMRMLHDVSTSHWSGLHNDILAPAVGWYAKPYLYQLVASLPFVLGWPLYALAVAGVGIAAARRSVADRVLIAGIAPYFAVMGGSAMVYPRYLLPLVPPLVVLAARAADSPGARRAGLLLFAAVFTYCIALDVSQVSRFSLDQQASVAAWLDGAIPAGERADVRIGVPQMNLDYYRLTGPLEARGLRQVELDDGHWFDDAPDYFVLPEWYEIAIERDMPGSAAAIDLARLRSGEAGYRREVSWSSSYLQRDFYTALDPAFAADLWQGEIGFTVYSRRGARQP